MEFREAVARLDAIVREVERDGDARALRLLELIDAVHREALERLVEGEDEHPAVRAVLAMYDLAEVDERTWAEEALDAVRPELAESGGGVDLVSLEGGVAELRPGGALRRDAAGAAGLRRVAEATLCGLAPFVEQVRWIEPADGVALPVARGGAGANGTAAGADNSTARATSLPMARGGARPSPPMAPGGARPSPPPAPDGGVPAASALALHRVRAPIYETVARAGEIAPGALLGARAGDADVVVANVRGELFALRGGCAVDGRPLEEGRLTGFVLVCPWHNCAYDVRTGRRVDEPDEPAVPVVPVAVRDGSVQVALGTRAGPA